MPGHGRSAHVSMSATDAESSGETRPELAGDEPRDLVEALAQRRDLHLGAADAKVEVLAEASGGDFVAKPPVARGADADGDLPGTRGPQRQDLAGLQHAQELRLHERIELRDLVEEERPLVSRLDVALGVVRRARVRPLARPEEQALGESLGNGGAVDGDERSARAHAVPCLVERARRELLSRAALAQHQERIAGATRKRDLAESAPQDALR